MRLFDDVPRTMGLRAPSNSTPSWEFLNRSSARDAGVVRDELEQWLGRYPENAQADLAARFRTENGGDTLAPFFELFLHELLLRLGCAVELHPQLPHTDHRPDFLAKPSSGSAFYLEATIAYEESADERAERTRRNEAFDTLNNLKDRRVFLTIAYEGQPRRSPPIARFRAQIEAALARITDDELQAADQRRGPDNPVAEWCFEDEGWVVEVAAYPRSESRRGDVEVRPISVTLGDVRIVTVGASVRKALVRKARHYGRLDLPFVVAVNARGRDGFGITYGEVMEALFGDESMEYAMTASGLPAETGQFVRQPNGAWRGPTGPRNTRVSACLIASRLFPWSIPRGDLSLYHHLLATHRFNSVLCQLPQYVPHEGKIVRVDGKALSDIFGLAGDWPGPREATSATGSGS